MLCMYVNVMQRFAQGGGQVQGKITWPLIDRSVIALRSTAIDGDRLITPAGHTGAAQCQVPLNSDPDNKLDWEHIEHRRGSCKGNEEEENEEAEAVEDGIVGQTNASHSFAACILSVAICAQHTHTHKHTYNNNKSY